MASSNIPSQERKAQLTEARLLLRYAATRLTKCERISCASIMTEATHREIAAWENASHGWSWWGRIAGLPKMRERLEEIGVRSVHDVISL